MKNRPPPTEPIHLILDSLSDLIERASTHDNKNKKNSMVEKYDYFIRHSDRGRACTYALKCKQLFVMSDLDDIKKEVEKLVSAIRLTDERYLK